MHLKVVASIPILQPTLPPDLSVTVSHCDHGVSMRAQGSTTPKQPCAHLRDVMRAKMSMNRPLGKSPSIHSYSSSGFALCTSAGGQGALSKGPSARDSPWFVTRRFVFAHHQKKSISGGLGTINVLVCGKKWQYSSPNGKDEKVINSTPSLSCKGC